MMAAYPVLDTIRGTDEPDSGPYIPMSDDFCQISQKDSRHVRLWKSLELCIGYILSVINN